MLVQTPLACAEARPAITSRAITLSAPDSVKALLDTHFELPDKPLTSETEQASFLRRAKLEIADLLATEGYFTPQVTLQSPRLDGSQLLKVILGPRTVVTQLDIEFKGELANDDPDHAARRTDIKSSWQLAVGAPFRSSDWENAKAALLARVSRADFAAAQLTLSSAKVDVAHASVQLAVAIDSGPSYRFGELDITGLSRYDRELVTNQIRFHKGDFYQRDQLLSFQTRLQNMSQFSSATINLDLDTATRQSAPVKVVITEMKPRKITLGLGYSDSNGARTEFNYLNHNFMGSALNLNNNLKLEQNRQTASASVDTAPDENGYVLSWGAVGQATHIAGLLTATDKLGVARSHTMGRIETRVGLGFQQEHRKPDGGIRQINQALVLDWQWHRRAIDDPLYPRSGNSTELRIGGGSQKFLSDKNFVRSYGRQQFWFPVGELDVVSLRGEAGYTSASSRLGIPQEYLFRAGGAQSVRGYAYQSLGVTEGAAVVGGRALLTGSLEYTHWFGGNWGMALFTDSGGAADSMKTLYASTGYGTGLRWRSPAGPLALDLAQNLKTHSLHMHFSIAAVF
jgi:translocation and assembly module TamA